MKLNSALREPIMETATSFSAIPRREAARGFLPPPLSTKGGKKACHNYPFACQRGRERSGGGLLFQRSLLRSPIARYAPRAITVKH